MYISLLVYAIYTEIHFETNSTFKSVLLSAQVVFYIFKKNVLKGNSLMLNAKQYTGCSRSQACLTAVGRARECLTRYGPQFEHIT